MSITDVSCDKISAPLFMNPQSPTTISCIIPARNEGSMLTVMVEALATEGSEIEIIVIDDASSPPLSERHPILRQPTIGNVSLRCERLDQRHGAARARNYGAERAHGRLLLFLDAHVLFSAGAIRQLASYVEHCPRAVIGAAGASCDDERKFVALAARAPQGFPPPEHYGWNIVLSPKPDLFPNRRRLDEEPFRVPIVGAASMLVPSALFHQLGGFESELSGSGNLEDSEFCLRAWANGIPVLVHPQAVCCHLKDAEKSRRKVPSPEQPYIIPWYDDCEENLFRVSYLHFPQDIHLRYFSGAATGRDLKNRCMTETLERHKKQLEQQRGCRPEDFFCELERLVPTGDVAENG
jgi:GT2 family glycosyltransferase